MASSAGIKVLRGKSTGSCTRGKSSGGMPRTQCFCICILRSKPINFCNDRSNQRESHVSNQVKWTNKADFMTGCWAWSVTRLQLHYQFVLENNMLGIGMFKMTPNLHKLALRDFWDLCELFLHIFPRERIFSLQLNILFLFYTCKRKIVVFKTFTKTKKIVQIEVWSWWCLCRLSVSKTVSIYVASGN